MSGKIEGIMCRKHNVELSWIPTGNPGIDKVQREYAKEQGAKHSRENGGCKIEPWKAGALKASAV